MSDFEERRGGVVAVLGQQNFSAARMMEKELTDIVDVTTDDAPEIARRVVLHDLFPVEFGKIGGRVSDRVGQ
jgi:hypothetical protein